MGKETGIGWTDHTFNTHWGCEEVSPGCDNCYAKAWAKRTGADLWGAETERRLFGEKHWAAPRNWNAAALKAGTRARVFCASMGDVFEDRRDLDAVRARLWPLIEATPALDWQLLTKRPQNIATMLPPAWLDEPRRNVWLGTTAEDQRRAAQRIPLLLGTPAVVHFVSAEPLLEALDLTPWLHERRWDTTMLLGGAVDNRVPALSWVIVGGESGPHCRDFNPAWASNIVAQCSDAGVACFVKQMGEAWARAMRKATLRKGHPHGADPAEWPHDLRVQEFPS